MAYCPDDMYLSDEDKLIGCNKNVRFGGRWDHQTYDPKKPSQTFPDDSTIRNNCTSSFGFMISVLFNILQFVTIWILISMILK